MLDIEKYKPERDGVLPRDEYVPLTRTDKTIPAQLLKTFSNIPRKKTKVKKSEAGKETVPNANYLWINLFATSLKEKGRATLWFFDKAKQDDRLLFIDAHNIFTRIDRAHREFNAQHELRHHFDPFFASLHVGLKELDKIVRTHEKSKAAYEDAPACANWPPKPKSKSRIIPSIRADM